MMLVDLRHPPSKDDEVMFEWLMQSETLFTVVATKADKLNKTETKKNVDALSEKFGINVIPFSSLNGTGVEELQQIITDLVLAD